MTSDVDDSWPPSWTGFSSAEEYEAFEEAVNEGLAQFGAEGRDGQDVSDGYATMAAGLPTVSRYEFPLDEILAECRDQPREKWPDICKSHVDSWATGRLQYEWLTAAPFSAVSERLEAWMSSKPEVMFRKDDRDHPDEPCSVAVVQGMYATFWVQVPEIGKFPAIPMFVPNKAVAAWNVDADELFEAARARLRKLPPPSWDVYDLEVTGDDGTVAVVPIHRCDIADKPVTTAASWALILHEVAPVPLPEGTLFAVPSRDLVLLSVPEPHLTSEQRLEAMYHFVDYVWQRIDASDEVSAWVHRQDADDVWTPVDAR